MVQSIHAGTEVGAGLWVFLPNQGTPFIDLKGMLCSIAC